MVLADITSGYNVVEDISREPGYADLCGFHEEEIRAVLEQIIADCDLSLIVRPDRRQYALLDHVIEFKHLKVGDLPGIDSDALACMPREDLRERPEAAPLLLEAEAQLAGYRKNLEGIYGDRLKLRTHALVRPWECCEKSSI